MRIRNPFLIRFAANCGVWLFRFLFLTLRRDGRDSVAGATLPEPPQHYIYATWHDSLLPPVFAKRWYGVAALISRHQDGSFLAEAMKSLHMEPVRGSSSRGGALAVRQLLENAGSKHIFITPDGPRGPRRRCKPGAIYLASQTGKPILACGVAGTRCWRMPGSWTDMLIPKPFSRVVLRSSKPIHIPPHLSREDIAAYTQLVEDAFADIFRHCERLAAGHDEPLPELPELADCTAASRAA